MVPGGGTTGGTTGGTDAATVTGRGWRTRLTAASSTLVEDAAAQSG
jgi:hypothetical protein